MNTVLIRSFALLFGAVIALICSIYVVIGMRRKKKQLSEEQEEINK